MNPISLKVIMVILILGAICTLLLYSQDQMLKGASEIVFWICCGVLFVDEGFKRIKAGEIRIIAERIPAKLYLSRDINPVRFKLILGVYFGAAILLFLVAAFRGFELYAQHIN